MTPLEQHFTALAQVHGLDCVSLTYHAPTSETPGFFAATVHTANLCKSALDDTPCGAFEGAIAKVNGERLPERVAA